MLLNMELQKFKNVSRETLARNIFKFYGFVKFICQNIVHCNIPNISK